MTPWCCFVLIIFHVKTSHKKLIAVKKFQAFILLIIP